MLDQQIESVSNKLVQFIQDLTSDIQVNINHENILELFQLRSDYAKQLASLFEMLIHQLIEEFLRNRSMQLRVNLDPVQIWRMIQSLVEQLEQIPWQEMHLVTKHIRNINKYFYNLLLQIKNVEFLKVDQTRTLNQNLIEELNQFSDSLIHLTTTVSLNSSKSDYSKPYLFPNTSTLQYANNNNNHITLPSDIPTAINSNCCPPPPSSNWIGCGRTPCFPSPPRTVPCTNVFPQTKPMGCIPNSRNSTTPIPLCFPTPVVYTPEMETLFSSGGIIYARKSGNTWVAENLGTLIETLKEIGQTIDMNEHCEILVRKTGELFARQKKGRRKRYLQQTFNKLPVNHPDDPTDSETSQNDDE